MGRSGRTGSVNMHSKGSENTLGNIANNYRISKGKWRPRHRFIAFLPLVILLFVVIPLDIAAKDLTCNRLPMLMEAFHENHYATKSMTPQIKAQAVEQMIKRLDPSKTLLYESDVQTIKPLLLELFVSVEKGNCAGFNRFTPCWSHGRVKTKRWSKGFWARTFVLMIGWS